MYIYIYIYTHTHTHTHTQTHSVIKKYGLNFVHLYFLNYVRYVKIFKTVERGDSKFSSTVARALA